MKLFRTEQKNTLFSPEKNLTQLANMFETDKGNADASTLSWGDEYPSHKCWGYTNTYEKYMKSLRTEPIKFLEIGICDKRFPYASQKMWLSYFQNIELYGMDNFWNNELNEKIEEIKYLNSMGANFIYADQGSFKDWDEIKTSIPNDLNFVVEDGSHWPNHMMVTMWECCDLIKSGGYYFIEDIQNPLKSRGWFRYDNSLLSEELLQTKITNKFYSSFLNDEMNNKVHESFELIELVLDPSEINYLAIFRKK